MAPLLRDIYTMRVCQALVLTCPPGSGRVTEVVQRTALAHIDVGSQIDAGLLPSGAGWQCLFSADDTADLGGVRRDLEAALMNADVDINIVPDDLAFRRKQLLAADMESTIIEQEMIDEIAGLIGRREEMCRLTAATMRGELDFGTSLTARVALFAGLRVDLLEELFDRITFMPGAETLVARMQAGGAKAALITGGFSIFAERVASRLGFDEVRANHLEVSHGKLTGRVLSPILGPRQKRDWLASLLKTMGLDPVLSLAVGDGANDIDMLGFAGLGVAFRAKPIAQAAARALPTGAIINRGDLTALLALQGL